ncbi:MAG TPA: tRNA pseudouridine(38-40) synthase TruA [Opitutaceae bacterium]
MKPSPEARRWKAVCAYDGTSFAGWQSQPGGKAIQDVIEARLAVVLGTPVRIFASGRTDAGVHAHGQVFHFDAVWNHEPDRLRAALKVGLPPTIQIKSVQVAAPDFHARFSATGKIYVYHLFLGEADPFTSPYALSIQRSQPFDLAAMESVAAVLRGRHDFAAYSAFNGAERDNTVRDLRRIDIRKTGRRVTLTFEADGFLYKMVRSLTGALVQAGDGILTAKRAVELMKAGERTAEVRTAPPHGLFLQKVFY